MLNSLCVIVIIMYKDNETENGHTNFFIVSAIFLLFLLRKKLFNERRLALRRKSICVKFHRDTQIYRIAFYSQLNITAPEVLMTIFLLSSVVVVDPERSEQNENVEISTKRNWSQMSCSMSVFFLENPEISRVIPKEKTQRARQSLEKNNFFIV